MVNTNSPSSVGNYSFEVWAQSENGIRNSERFQLTIINCSTTVITTSNIDDVTYNIGGITLTI